MDPPLRVLMDANIWFSRTLRDWFLLLQTEMDETYFPNLPPYLFFWTEDILAETYAGIRDKKPCQSEKYISDAIGKIKETLTDRRKISGYVPKETNLTSDEGDWHVVSAALHGGIDVLLTQDKDFCVCDDYEIWTPDQLLMDIAEKYEKRVLVVLHKQYQYWSKMLNKGPITSFNLSQMLKNSGASEFGDKCVTYLDLLNDKRLLELLIN